MTYTAYTVNKGTCNGDSGGPLFTDDGKTFIHVGYYVTHHIIGLISYVTLIIGQLIVYVYIYYVSYCVLLISFSSTALLPLVKVCNNNNFNYVPMYIIMLSCFSILTH